MSTKLIVFCALLEREILRVDSPVSKIIYVSQVRPPRLSWRKCRDISVGQHMTRHNKKKATVRPLPMINSQNLRNTFSIVFSSKQTAYLLSVAKTNFPVPMHRCKQATHFKLRVKNRTQLNKFRFIKFRIKPFSLERFRTIMTRKMDNAFCMLLLHQHEFSTHISNNFFFT